MSDRFLIGAFGTSLLIHLGLLPILALLPRMQRKVQTTIPIELVDAPKIADIRKTEIATPAPKPQPKLAKIIAPKLLSKPTIFETPPTTPIGNTKQEIKEPEKVPDAVPRFAALPESAGSAMAGWNLGNKSPDAEGGAAGAGNLFGRGDVGVVGGRGVEGSGGGTGNSVLGRGSKGDGTGGGGIAAGDGLTGLAHPLGGYQVRPRYPESARRAGVQGTTLLKLRVLENGRVGEVMVEQSAGHRDLDRAAAEAVKKWLFEPARIGKEAVAVWVLLPVKFELQR
jgi:TonB family protein